VLDAQIWVNAEADWDGANLKISTDGGSSFQLLTTDLAYSSSAGGQAVWGGDLSASGWQLVSVDLSPYVGDVVIVQFEFYSDTLITAPGVYVDDVHVTAY
jgi:bacillopeptidase F (M6 metalloprotease family)